MFHIEGNLGSVYTVRVICRDCLSGVRDMLVLILEDVYASSDVNMQL